MRGFDMRDVWMVTERSYARGEPYEAPAVSMFASKELAEAYARDVHAQNPVTDLADGEFLMVECEVEFVLFMGGVR
jgi:hypothetical protein